LDGISRKSGEAVPFFSRSRSFFSPVDGFFPPPHCDPSCDLSSDVSRCLLNRLGLSPLLALGDCFRFLLSRKRFRPAPRRSGRRLLTSTCTRHAAFSWRKASTECLPFFPFSCSRAPLVQFTPFSIHRKYCFLLKATGDVSTMSLQRSTVLAAELDNFFPSPSSLPFFRVSFPDAFFFPDQRWCSSFSGLSFSCDGVERTALFLTSGL